MCLQKEVEVKARGLQECLDYAAMCRRHYHQKTVVEQRGKVKKMELAAKKPKPLKIERTGTPLERALAAEKRAKKK